jgi:hypothetical protein
MKKLVVVVVALLAGCAKNIPIPDVKVSSDEALVARGKYLAEGPMGCIVCHSKRDYTKFGGPVVAGSEFGGSDDIAVEDGFPDGWHFGGPNLTPHRLKDWSDGEIVRAILFGQSKDGHGLFPMMPYQIWRDTEPLDDAVAVVAYLRTLKPIDHDVVKRQLPIPGFVLDGFPEPHAVAKAVPAKDSPHYGAYVVASAGCVDCHTQADERNNYIAPRFSGGREFPVPKPGKGFLHSANLTSDDTGLGKWTKEIFIAKFKSSTLDAARAQSVGDDGFNSIMPWWAYSMMTEEDLGAIWDYLHALPPTKNLVAKITPTSTKPAK